MNNYKSDNKLKWALIAALVCVGYLIWATFYNLSQSEYQSTQVKNSLERLLQIENILVNIKTIESGQRGFIISGDETFLESFYKGMEEIKRDTVALKAIFLADENELPEMQNLLQLINARINFSKKTVEIFRLFGSDSAHSMVESKQGIDMMNQISDLITKLKTNERIILKKSTTDNQKFARRTSRQLLLLGLVFLFIIAVSYYIINKNIKKILSSKKQLKYNASLIRNISDPIITTDKEENITNWNAYAEVLYGYKETEVLKKNVRALLEKKKNFTGLKNKAEQNADSDYWKGELIHYHKSGTPIYVEASASSIKDEEGNITGTVSVIRNITQRKQNEEQLKRLTLNLEEEVKIKTTELQNIFSRITDAFIALDKNWNYTYLNSQAAELHGKSVEDLIGKNIWAENPDVLEEPFYDALQLANNTGLPQKLQLYYSKLDRWYEDLIYPSPDGISVYYHDITNKKKAEIGLQAAHEKLNYHINNTPMAVVEFNVHKKIIQWSQRATEMFGWTSEEMMQEENNLQKLVFPKDIALVQKAFDYLPQKKLDNGILHLRNNTNDGRVIHCDWYNSVLKNAEGEIIGIMSLVQDVTRRKEIEKQLLEEESKFRNLVEQSMVGVFIIQDNRYAYVNPKLVELVGYSEEEMLQNIPVLNLVHTDNKDFVLRNIRDRLNGLKPHVNYQLKVIKKNGEVFYAEVFGSATQYLGKPAIIGTLIDVTERRQAIEKIRASESALQKSNERFLLVSKATNDAVWDWDLQTNTVWGNDAFRKIFYTDIEGEFSIENFLKNVHKDDLDHLLSNFKNSVKEQNTLVTELFRYKDRDDNYRILDDKAYIIFDENKRAIRMLGAMRDITEEKEAQKKLLLEKTLSDSIINSLPGIFYLINQRGKYIRWNKNFETVTGYNADEVANSNPLHYFLEKDHAMIQTKIENVYFLGEAEVEIELRTKKGNLIPYYLVGKQIMYEDETCLVGCGFDISEKIKTQRELLENEEKFRILIEQASDGIFISNMKGELLDVNSNGIKLTGYTKEELMNLSISDLIPPGDEENNPLKFDEILAGKVVVNERKMQHKDGHLVHVEISAKLLTDGRFLGIVRDINARKKNEEALRLSEEKYRLLFYQNPMPMWMISIPERNFLDVNAASIDFYGYSKQEFLSMNIMDIRPQEDVEIVKKSFYDGVAGISRAGIWRHVKKDGSIITVDIISHNIEFEGKPARLILANDVTEKMMAEDKLQKSHEAFRQLATHLESIREAERTYIAREIHDELGQQLTGLKMDISWLNKKIVTQDAEVKKKIYETIELIDSTVRSVRRIATELRPSILDDLGLVAAMEWQSEEFEKRFEITCVFQNKIQGINIEPVMATGIFRIYQESLTNVLRHAEASRVSSFLQIKDNELQLNITDNGKGFIVKDIANKKTLGLLGMKERASLMGGTYQITSEPGGGTSVVIIVPLNRI